MVARIVFGREIAKAIRYNEEKVAKGKGSCLEAAGFGLEPGELSIKEKAACFEELTSRRKMVHTNAVHISLNFHPDEKLSDKTLKEIASRYMELIGFGDQPYLLYEHMDAGHPHMHIVTTNIRYDGSLVDTQWINKNKSEPARKELEEQFGLIKASGRDIGRQLTIQPLDSGILQYGAQETKAAISNVVKEVIRSYKFSNLEEFRQILLQFNVTVDEGKEGSRLHRMRGLMYSLVDNTGKKLGRAIKASSIHTKPTLPNLQEKYAQKNSQKQRYKGRLTRVIDDAILAGGSKEYFTAHLEAANVRVVFHTNENDFTYGVTFIDNLTKCVFKGSDLKKGYAAGALLQRITEASDPAYQYNFLFTSRILQKTDFSRPLHVLKWWKKAGLKMLHHVDRHGNTVYFFGHSKTPEKSFVAVPAHINNYIEALRSAQENRSRFSRYRSLLEDKSFLDALGKHLQKGIHDIAQAHTELLEPIYTGNALPHALLREAKKKKRKRKK